jgi:hypothetical protein
VGPSFCRDLPQKPFLGRTWLSSWTPYLRAHFCSFGFPIEADKLLASPAEDDGTSERREMSDCLGAVTEPRGREGKARGRVSAFVGRIPLPAKAVTLLPWTFLELVIHEKPPTYPQGVGAKWFA